MITARSEFHRLIAERRQYPRGSADWQWRTQAARKLLWIMQGVPPKDWRDAA